MAESPTLVWYKASLCKDGECVQIAVKDGVIIMGSSCSLDELYFTPAEFAEFLEKARRGDFDHSKIQRRVLTCVELQTGLCSQSLFRRRLRLKSP